MKTSPSQQTIANRVDCVASAVTVQQAEKPPVGAERFLQIAEAKPMMRRHKLTRVPFQVSRLMEFCSLRELQNQTGHNVWDWPLVVLKEMLDNALDACEEVGVAPVVNVSVSPTTGTIVIDDNGPGIPEETIRAVCDYTIRVSSREAYVSPSRGAQGNALKTILAMGYVVDRERLSQGQADAAEATGRTTIETRGTAHTILFLVDHVTNEPRIVHTIAPSPITIGTRITIKWPQSPHGCGSVLESAEEQFKVLAESYVWFNPHLTLRGAWDGADFVYVEATNPDWTKWRPSDPTSPHWYTEARLQRYLSAHVARDRHLGRDRPVREFIAEFRGLSGTRKQKAILAEIGVSRLSLRSFFGEDRVNRIGIGQLLKAMKRHSLPVPPKHLGVISREHLKARFMAAGGAEETFKYERQTGISQDIPYVVECAFGLRQSGLDGSSGEKRLIVTGANWSVGIQNPFRRFGRTGEGLESKLAEVRANATQPVILALHLASAHIQYADRGKSSIIIDGDVEATDV
jgi:DNA topoisomerase VI subunit B